MNNDNKIISSEEKGEKKKEKKINLMSCYQSIKKKKKKAKFRKTTRTSWFRAKIKNNLFLRTIPPYSPLQRRKQREMNC